MAWFVVKTKMKRRWLFALPGKPQDFKNLQSVKVNKLDFMCQQKFEIVIDKLGIEYHQTVVSVRYLTCI